MVLRNNTRDWIEIGKGTPVARMVAANQVPRVIDTISADKPKEQPTLTETERRALLLDKLDLSGLEAWPTEQAEKARGLLREYHDIFSLEKHDMGHTNATKHKIVLKDPDTLPFKERFRRIPPPQLDEEDEASKQYTAFTQGSMGLYECESMPFGLCNAPPTFQRLMQNCLGELNLTYCLIYLDDVIVFSETPEEHLLRMRVVFDCLREHGLTLKPSKCDVFKLEIN